MQGSWKDIKNLLCIRLDNMGDLLMSSPAIHALKKSLRCKISLLTSSAGAAIAPYIGNIDQIIISDVPWVKGEKQSGAAEYLQLVEKLRQHQFDAAVIFTVFSQNPMPSVMLAYLGLPRRTRYRGSRPCRGL
jgi:ADP-heptose:LPS heptosyltransferase